MFQQLNNNNSNNDENKLNYKSGLDLIVEESINNSHIITFCMELDQMLNGGVPLKKLTEFSGVPGIGKTQMCFQLAVNCCLPVEFGGVAGKTLYIDTEGTFSVPRIKQMASALIEHLGVMVQEDSTQRQQVASNLSVDDILASIHYYRVHHYIEQQALIHMLPVLLDTYPDIRLIVIDSITYPFRRHFSDHFQRSKALAQVANNLLSIAQQKNVAVVLTNHVVTKIRETSESQLVPALGDAWGLQCTNRITMYYKQGKRYCHLFKSASSGVSDSDSQYNIDETGLRGIITEVDQQELQQQPDQDFDLQNDEY